MRIIENDDPFQGVTNDDDDEAMGELGLDAKFELKSTQG